jgi:hypothetical protein
MRYNRKNRNQTVHLLHPLAIVSYCTKKQQGSFAKASHMGNGAADFRVQPSAADTQPTGAAGHIAHLHAKNTIKSGFTALLAS